MPAAPRSLALLLLGSIVACLPPDLGECASVGCTEAAPGSSDGVGTTQPTGEGMVQTVTGPGTATTGDAPDEATSGSTTGAAVLPEVVKVEVDPDPIAVNGLIAVGVETAHADGVRMKLEDGTVSELAADGRMRFAGHIPAFTGLKNGRHTVGLTPWRGGLEGVEFDAEYTIALPEPGSQGPWKTGDAVGVGSVVALGVLPDAHVVEFGTFDEQGEPRCYLRRRAHGDASWQPEDLVTPLPGAYCNAIDMQIDRLTGTLHLLAERKSGDGLQWWLGEIASWGKGAKQIGLGALGDDAQALALGADGVLAVCGGRAAPLPFTDVDAAAWVVRPGQAKTQRLFDYAPNGEDKAHSLFETARDCVFAGDTLVMVGEATGFYGADVVVRDRHFVLEYETGPDTEHWTVAGSGPGSDTNNRAVAVALDDQGHYLLAGYSCGDACIPAGETLVYAPGGKLIWQGSMGVLGSELAGPYDIAWSPAGYMVVALAAFGEGSFRFEVRAYAQGEFEPLWTYKPNDMTGLQFALTLAIGEFGEVYAGGLGEGKFPAVAYIPG